MLGNPYSLTENSSGTINQRGLPQKVTSLSRFLGGSRILLLQDLSADAVGVANDVHALG